MDAWDAKSLADVVDRIDLRADIVVPDHILHTGVGRFPADHENGYALIDRPFHEALLLVQVENIEAIDPRRENDHRGGQYLVRRRGILHELVQRRLMDDLSRRRRNILAQLECRRICMGQLPAPHVGEQVLHASHEILPSALHGSFHDHGVEEGKVRRTCCFGDGFGRKTQLVALLRTEAVHTIDHFADPLGKE